MDTALLARRRRGRRRLPELALDGVQDLLQPVEFSLGALLAALSLLQQSLQVTRGDRPRRRARGWRCRWCGLRAGLWLSTRRLSGLL